MKIKWFKSEVLFIITAAIYFAIRKPAGGVVDELERLFIVLISVALVLICIKHVLYRWYK